MMKLLMKSSGISALAMIMAMGAMPAQTLAAESAQRGEAQNQRGGGNAWGGQSSRQSGNEARAPRMENRAPRMESRARVESPNVASRNVDNRNRAENRAPAPRVGTPNAERAPNMRAQPAQSRNTAPATLPQGWERDFRNAGNAARARQAENTRNTPAPNPRTEQRNERFGDARDDRRSPNNDARDSNRGNTRDTDRNRSYADRDRNRSYTDRDRNQNRDWNRQQTQRNDRDWNRNRSANNNATRYYYQDGKRHQYSRWNHNAWRNDNRYNWSDYRRSNSHIYRVGRYNAPYYGNRYNRFSIGLFLGSGYYASNYWINDPWHYRLPAAHGPYRWVRYYDDALLVDIYSGEVLDVIYDFFW